MDGLSGPAIHRDIVAFGLAVELAIKFVYFIAENRSEACTLRRPYTRRLPSQLRAPRICDKAETLGPRGARANSLPLLPGAGAAE